MPELPDVEAFRRFFREHAAGRTVTNVTADPTIVRNATPRTLGRALEGRTFDEPERVGKWLIARTDGPTLLVHFGMTGDLIWSEAEPERHRHDRLILEFEDRREFLDLLARRRGGVKAALMDQTFIAGVGNIIADEILWHARIHPRRTIQSLTEDERRRLFTETRKILREAVNRYDYIPRKRSWLSGMRGVPGARCPRCGTLLQRTTAAGRTTYFCPHCQATDPVPLAT
jgi:formamidopyrimidine-DNA glycosylase